MAKYVNAGVVTKDGTKDTITIGDTTYMGPKYTPGGDPEVDRQQFCYCGAGL